MRKEANTLVPKSLIIRLFLIVFLVLFLTGKPRSQPLIAIADSLAQKSAKEILSAGGNVVDAGISALLTLAVVEQFSTSLGGSGIFVICPKNSSLPIIIECMGPAPKNVDPRLFYRSPGDFDLRGESGFLSVCVPGLLAGAELALKKYGTLSWDAIAAPAMELAEKGFPVSNSLKVMLMKNYNALMDDNRTFEYFFPDWIPPKSGEYVNFPVLANTLKLLSENGSEIFYRGEIAQKISLAFRRKKGLLSEEDLSNYLPHSKAALTIQFQGTRIAAPPLPSAGGLVLLTLMKLLEKSNLNALEMGSGEEVVFYVRAYQKALALAGKFLLNDGKKSIEEQQRFLDNIKSNDFEEYSIDRKTLAPLIFREGQGAATIAIVDSENNAILFSSSLNDYFGSKTVIEGTGILFNNFMNAFSPQSGFINSIKPGAQNLTWVTPIVVYRNSKPILLIGSNGANRNVLAIARFLFNFINKKDDPVKLMKMPRFHFDFVKNIIVLESRFSASTLEYLKTNGFKFDLKIPFDIFFGNFQIIAFDENKSQYRAISDVRREGEVYVEY